MGFVGTLEPLALVFNNNFYLPLKLKGGKTIIGQSELILYIAM